MKTRGQAGFTYLEMVATAAILMILASAVLPLARVTRIRQREIELQRSLRTVRRAIDDYNLTTRQGKIQPKLGEGSLDPARGAYPPDLKTLVEGVVPVGQPDTTKKLKFLRRIPIDPMTRTAEWGLRCYEDEPDSDSWCGDNVYDVYSKSGGKALDGTKYKDW